MSALASVAPIAGAGMTVAPPSLVPVDDGEERAAKRLKRESAAAAAAAAADEDDDEDMEDDGEDDGEVGPNGKKSGGGKGGSSCHQCKSRRNLGALIYCSAHLDKNGKKKCRKKVCGHCLKKFYKESVAAIVDKSTWKCPSCRKICCCAACRRRKTKESGKADADVSPMQAASSGASTKKKKKSSDENHPAPERSSTRERRTTYSSDHHYGGHGEDEGYPPSTNHRRNAYGESPARSRHAGNAYDMMDTGGYSSNDQYYSDSEGQGGDGASEMASENAGDEPVAPAQQILHEDDASSSLPSSQFTALLSSHIKSLAEESARSPNSPFARLYKQAQATRVKKKIKAILLRPDIRKEKKVELIAALLAPLEDTD